MHHVGPVHAAPAAPSDHGLSRLASEDSHISPPKLDDDAKLPQPRHEPVELARERRERRGRRTPGETGREIFRIPVVHGSRPGEQRLRGLSGGEATLGRPVRIRLLLDPHEREAFRQGGNSRGTAAHERV